MSTELNLPEVIKNRLSELQYNENIFRAIKSSLYPGAKDESVLMVMENCRAAEIDPLLKAYHIAPMYIEDKKTGQKGMKDVVMPSIDLHRIKAARSGVHFGTSEPEYGPIKTFKFGQNEVNYPEWAAVVVKKLVAGQVVEFKAKEFWLENYATASKDTIAPNYMWRKRPFAQLAKCAEAQALRRAFPELCAAVTAEEMEGKHYEPNVFDGEYENISAKKKIDELVSDIVIEKEEVKEAADEQRDEVTLLIEAINNCDDQKQLMQYMKGLAKFNPEQRANITLAFNERTQQLKEPSKKSKEHQDFIDEMDNA